jgi:hypothetical protein
MGRCNPRHVFPVYTCGRHRNSNIPTAMKIPTHLGFTATAAAPLRLLHPVHRCASAIGRGGLQNRRPQQSCIGRGRIRFLGSNLRDCSLASSSSSPRLVYLFVGLAEGRRLQRELRQADHRLHPVVIVKKSQVTFGSSLKTCLTYLIC